MAVADEPGVSDATELQDRWTSTQMIDGRGVPLSIPAESYLATNTDPSAAFQPAAEQFNGLPEAHAQQSVATDEPTHPLDVFCGPLLNYKWMAKAQTESPAWHGSVLLVTKPGDVPPGLELRHAGRSDGRENFDGSMVRNFTGFKLYSDPAKTFWRIDLELPMQDSEAKWTYTIPNVRFVSGLDRESRATRTFFVPSRHESMRIMFHSCNGFSVGTDEDAWSGPALWNDVVRIHHEKPFHVMIGGGDQIYNDSVRVAGPLKEWTAISNPKKRRDYRFTEELRARCDEYYFNNYVRWYSTEAFATANGEIPQINIWDDHDIIDGFGSYTDHFMRCHVFRGIGGVAQKYYLLFQHHCAPPVSTFTSDAPQTMQSQGPDGTGADPVQLKDTFVLKDQQLDPSWIIGSRPGPYVAERSRSMFARLGKGIGFVGLDARTERTRHQINYWDTYDLVMQRVHSELTAAAGEIRHLIVLLGVPIAYPRLIWLENILRSPLIGPIRFLNKRFGVADGFFNHFDGGVDLLDDLDDHYTARQHKAERKELMLRLQEVSRTHQVRVTILGGDVHLAALGRFYSNPKLQVAIANDHRYMVNVVSSAITNKPPPKAVANMLARRNRIHHLDAETDETLMDLFNRGPGNTIKAAANNHCTMPSRNYAILNETINEHGTNGTMNSNGALPNGTTVVTTSTKPKDGHSPLHAGEQGAGTDHPAASGLGTRHVPGPCPGLDISIRVEIDPGDREGHTEGYGLHGEFPSNTYLSITTPNQIP